MARGIGGDDGPTLFMFVAVVLIWGTISRWMNSAKTSISDGLELGKNSAGPLQSQTTADITRIEDTVKSWHVEWSALRRPKTYYQNIADSIFKECGSSVNIDEQAIINLCRPLNKNELMAVAKCYGVRENTFVGLTTWTGHIFQDLEQAFTGTFKGRERAEIKRIWAVTKIW